MRWPEIQDRLRQHRHAIRIAAEKAHRLVVHVDDPAAREQLVQPTGILSKRRSHVVTRKHNDPLQVVTHLGDIEFPTSRRGAMRLGEFGIACLRHAETDALAILHNVVWQTRCLVSDRLSDRCGNRRPRGGLPADRALPRPFPQQLPPVTFFQIVPGEKCVQPMADYSQGRPAIDRFGSRVPVPDDALRIADDDTFRGQVSQSCLGTGAHGVLACRGWRVPLMGKALVVQHLVTPCSRRGILRIAIA